MSSSASSTTTTDVFPPKDAPMFSLKGRRSIGRATRVIDGDTVDVVLGLDDSTKYYTFTCRLVGIDTPELKSKDPSIRSKATMARERLQELTSVDEGLVDVECHEFDKYGRLLVVLRHLVAEDKSINETMMEEGHAVQYKA